MKNRMKNKMVMSIVVTSFASLLIHEKVMADEPAQPSVKVTHKAPKSSGKCASGKCGTEKIYGQAKIKHNPQDKLVFARDGKCGSTGYGLEPSEKEVANKAAGGVCGQ